MCIVPAGPEARTWPLVTDVAGRFYCEPETGGLLVSPADETPSEPCDARPEELDVAVALDRLAQATTLRPRDVRRAWAGLRTFSPDRSPVAGEDPDHRGFYWLAGQGGAGIKTAPRAFRDHCRGRAGARGSCGGGGGKHRGRGPVTGQVPVAITRVARPGRGTVKECCSSVRRSELEAARGHPVDDLLGSDVRLLFVGINPGLWTASVNAHFARPGNRFWPALHPRGHHAPRLAQRPAGMACEDAAELVEKGVGITNLVERGHRGGRRAGGGGAACAGVARLRALTAAVAPCVVAVLGLTAYRVAFQRPKATAGEQAGGLGGAGCGWCPTRVVSTHTRPSTSLATSYRAIAEAAGVPLVG